MCSSDLMTTVGLLVSSSVTGSETASEAYQRGDFDIALREFEFQANAGDRIAQNNLGVMYLKGRGVDVDYRSARDWFTAAAEQDLAGAMFNLGIMSLRGYGQVPDAEAASHWFRKAAERGDHEAQFFLALQYTRGNGVEQSPQLAARWFEDAANGGLPAEIGRAHV